ncbi:phosphoserine phosphatase [Brevipalpus obovatus]|uniref:phosphoserine phosphatase n=1 Tax=Brevipalpus obovatus TaxID=246614 RepID=UPI003D9E7DAA
MAHQRQTENLVRALWRSVDAVCFDVDSTVCKDEAIDELAKFAKVEMGEVVKITQLAMRGGCSFQEALASRLDLIKPSRKLVYDFIQKNPPRLTPGIKELVDTLHRRGVDVFLVSGGFDVIIEPVATELNIPFTNIFANRLKFFYDGSYAGFDETAPTSQQDGKAQVCAYLKERFDYQTVIMVGDGATDLAACPPADAFIGFGGNQARDTIKRQAKWFVTSFKEMNDELNRN